MLFGTIVSAQDQHEADSLIGVLKNTEVPDSSRYEMLRRIALQSTRPDEIVKYADELIELASKHNEFVWLHRGYLQKGNAYKLLGDFETAIRHYFKSAEMARQGGYQTGVGGAFLAIADAYGNNGDHSNGLRYRRQAISILRYSGDSLNLAAALLNAGYEYYQVGQFDSALFYYQESGQIYELKDFLLGKAYNLGNAGLVYAKTGEHGKATQFLAEATDMLVKLGDSYGITEFQTEMASIYQQKGDFAAAESLLLEALKYAQADGLRERIRDASFGLSELYRLMNDHEKAYSHLSRYVAYRDSINNEDIIRKMADLRTEFEVGRKQAEVDLLNAQARTQRLLLIGGAVVLLLILVVVYVLFKLYKLRERAIKISKERRKIIASQRNKLEELNDTKDRFFSIISHDIRGPVNNFHGVAQLLQMSLDSGETEDLVFIAQTLEKSSMELSALLDNLLHWAMSQQGKFPYFAETINLTRLCNDNLSMMENMAASKEIQLSGKVEAGVKLVADKNSVSTIIRNLLSNALKFTEKGGRVSLSLETNDEGAVIRIADTGVGMSEEKMKTLFGFEAGRSHWGTAGEKGVGLGLNLVKEFVDMNHGRIEVESEEGKGTAFTVYFPFGAEPTN